MNKGKILKININSRVAVDAAFFHEIQPNYSRPSLRDLAVKDKGGITVFDIGAILIEDREREKERIQRDGVDTQKLRETDFLVACLTYTVSALRDVDYSLPGVGKTFTVKATLEYFKLLLYSISAGKLVIDHGDSNILKQQLETVFKIAKHFNTVLLLDEADAFIEQRTSYYDNHNRLVTIFLRKLEYYQGILFLTSNRGIQFDDAILSRIYLVIRYKNLTREFRRDLWSIFLSKAYTIKGPAVVEEHELRRLESFTLNRREVNYKYLELAAESNKKFSKEFGQKRPADGMYV
ncbi:uncharacterized protein N7458_009123 [Penicillium daleae]|uniref:ATPase AAA-type core domain-containing protein n=1 Tax=Penicillium daleae TaxID=63821 RepID=A0AAD6BWX7_9EURO|nr:uncharacterized protein N7458_009123 [Penicillium daleae]KAJ5438125.1 hypothetical protein N7458_009123 [Penicillium daleae]